MANSTWNKYRQTKTRLLEQGVWFCLSCEQNKPVDKFYKSASKSWPSSHCKPCQNKKLKKQTKDQVLQYTYSISLDDYNRMLDAQNGGCAICKQIPDKRMLAVDHDHSCCLGTMSCGKCVRGLLCFKCNSALGKFDTKTKLESAILYLDKK